MALPFGTIPAADDLWPLVEAAGANGSEPQGLERFTAADIRRLIEVATAVQKDIGPEELHSRIGLVDSEFAQFLQRLTQWQRLNE